MSLGAFKAVKKHSRATGTTFLVHLALADFYNDHKGYAYPSYSTLAAWTRLSSRHVKRCVKELQRIGEVSVSRAPGRRTNAYELQVYSSVDGDTLSPFSPLDGDTLSPQGCQDRPPDGDRSAQEVGQPVTRTRTDLLTSSYRTTQSSASRLGGAALNWREIEWQDQEQEHSEGKNLLLERIRNPDEEVLANLRNREKKPPK